MLPIERITKDPVLQQEMERLYNMRLAVNRILTLSTVPLHQLEATKTLQVINLKLMSCLRVVQQQRVADAHAAPATGQNLAETGTDNECRAADADQVGPPRLCRRANPGLSKLCLAGIRIPLLWSATPPVPGANMQIIINRLYPPASTGANLLAMTTGSGDGGTTATRGAAGDDFDSGSDLAAAWAGESYSVFCVVYVNDEIKDTRLIFDVRPNTADVEFDDNLVFDNVPPDFRLVVEVYASAPRSNNLKRSWYPDYMKKATELMDLIGGNSTGAGLAQFELIGSSVSTIADIQQNIQTRSLELGGQRAAASCHDKDSYDRPTTTTIGLEPGAQAAAWGLPVFGSICYQLVAQPQSVLTPVLTGDLWIRTLTPSPAQDPAYLYHCTLVNRCLEATRLDSKEKESDNTPLISLSSQMTSETDGHSTESDQPRTCSEHEKLPKSAFTLSITPMTKFLDSSPQLRSVDVAVNLPVAISKSRPQLIDELGNRLAAVVGAGSSVNRVPESLPINGEAAVVLPVNMPTFRIAIQSPGSPEEAHCPLVSSVHEVFEIASPGHIILGLTTDGSSLQLEQLSDPFATVSWLTALQQHSEEQKTWGDAAFANRVTLPSSTSTVCTASSKRASTILLPSQLK